MEHSKLHTILQMKWDGQVMFGNAHFLGNMYSLPLLKKTLLLTRGQDSTLKTSFNLYYFPRAPSSNTIILGIKTLTRTGGRNPNVQSIALHKYELSQLSSASMPPMWDTCMGCKQCSQSMQILSLEVTMGYEYRGVSNLHPCFRPQK